MEIEHKYCVNIVKEDTCTCKLHVRCFHKTVITTLKVTKLGNKQASTQSLEKGGDERQDSLESESDEQMPV